MVNVVLMTVVTRKCFVFMFYQPTNLVVCRLCSANILVRLGDTVVFPPLPASPPVLAQTQHSSMLVRGEFCAAFDSEKKIISSVEQIERF